MSEEETRAGPAEGGQLVPVTQVGPSPLAKWFRRTGEFATSLDTNTTEGAQAYLKATRGADQRAMDCVQQELKVMYWLAHEVDPIVSDDGEVGSSVRLVWILEDGRTVATRSPSILNYWHDVIQFADKLGWQWPISVVLKRVKVDATKSYLEVECVKPAGVVAKEKRKGK